MLRRPLELGQYTSIRYTERLAEIGAAPSVGSVGDPIDNAIAESTIGLFKTELIRRHGPWKHLDDLELAALGWIDWFNHRRLHGGLGHVPPAELEATHYRSRAAPIRVQMQTTGLHPSQAGSLLIAEFAPCRR